MKQTMTIEKQKDLYDSKEFYSLVALIIFYFNYTWINNYLIIGLDFNYYFFVRVLPFLLGILTFGLIKYKRLKFIYINDKTKRSKKALIGLYLFLSIVFSFFTFNTVAEVIWIEKIKAGVINKKTTHYNCNIEKLISSNNGNGKSVSFLYNGKKEFAPINNEVYKQYKDKLVSELYLEIAVRNSFDNYDIVDHYSIKLKNN
jgi:hypothetical protein